MINTTIVGADDLLKILSNMKATEAKKAVRKGSRAAAKIIAAQAKADAPKHTGLLSKNIKVKALARSRRYTGCTVKETSDHAGFTEFGTKDQKGQHAFEKAFNQVKDSAKSEFINVMKTEIEQSLGGK